MHTSTAEPFEKQHWRLYTMEIIYIINTVNQIIKENKHANHMNKPKSL